MTAHPRVNRLQRLFGRMSGPGLADSPEHSRPERLPHNDGSSNACEVVIEESAVLRLQLVLLLNGAEH